MRFGESGSGGDPAPAAHPDAVEQLEQFSLGGRPGRSPGTTQLVIAGLPYPIVYGVDAVDPRSVAVLEVLHGAMLWPPA